MTQAPPWLERARQLAAKAAAPTRFEMKKSGEKVTLYLYSEIGENPWGEGTTAKAVLEALDSVKGAESLDVHVNSPGGAVFEGLAIYNAIKNFPGKRTTYVDGIAGSIASVIMLAGERVVMSDGAMVMIHEPSSGIMVYGSADMIEDEARKTASALRKVRESILDVYATNTGQELARLSEWMAAETWMTAAEAKARGFADEIVTTANPEPEPVRSAVAPVAAPLPRPSPGTEAALARARVRSLNERFSGASVGASAGPPAATQTKTTKGRTQ